ncbi:MAG: polyprenyl synthetase family protein, partial [Thermomicrobiales bacterium]
IRDDLLGIWGEDATTGKTRGDDIRRRKQSLPILLLRASASASDLARLNELFALDEVHEAGIDQVLTLLDAYGVQDQVQQHIDHAHERAEDARLHLGSTEAGSELAALVSRLQLRTS